MFYKLAKVHSNIFCFTGWIKWGISLKMMRILCTVYKTEICTNYSHWVDISVADETQQPGSKDQLKADLQCLFDILVIHMKLLFLCSYSTSTKYGMRAYINGKFPSENKKLNKLKIDCRDEQMQHKNDKGHWSFVVSKVYHNKNKWSNICWNTEAIAKVQEEKVGPNWLSL